MSPLIFLAWVLVVFITCVLFLGLILVFLEQYLKFQIAKNVDPMDRDLIEYLAEWEHDHEHDK